MKTISKYDSPYALESAIFRHTRDSKGNHNEIWDSIYRWTNIYLTLKETPASQRKTKNRYNTAEEILTLMDQTIKENHHENI